MEYNTMYEINIYQNKKRGEAYKCGSEAFWGFKKEQFKIVFIIDKFIKKFDFKVLLDRVH